MPPVITVENLSKAYRIGAAEEKHETLAAQLWSTIKTPLRNLSRLKKLDAYRAETTREEDDIIWALRDVSFEVQQGEVLGIIGKNGAGKSTLLKILSRITDPTHGQITIHGRVSSLLEVGTGFHPDLTGRENIYMNGTVLGMRKREIDAKFDQIVDFSGISKFIDTPIKRYSSGMTVRLAFAVAAHLDPDILIVDEVLAVGDAEFQSKCLGKMKDVAGHGRTVLFVSHQLGMLQNLCPKAILMHHGQVKMEGKSGEVISSYFEDLRSNSESRSQKSDAFLYYEPDAEFQEDVRITGLQMLNECFAPKKILCTWDFVTFRIHYHALRTIENSSLEFQVATLLGNLILNFSTRPDSNFPLEIQPGIHTLDLCIPQFPLSQGMYSLSMHIAETGKRYITSKENACKLCVEPKDVFNSGFPPNASRYLIACPHVWKRSF